MNGRGLSYQEHVEKIRQTVGYPNKAYLLYLAGLIEQYKSRTDLINRQAFIDTLMGRFKKELERDKLWTIFYV